MNERFFDLRKEKQDRIINAALKIFAENGYRRASTDEIITEAGISKGLLFHYFGSKINLYAFLFDYATRYAIVELKSGVPRDETDYFRLQRMITAAETDLMRQYPYILLFLDTAEREQDEDAAEVTREKRGDLATCIEGLLSGADRSVFPRPSDVTKLTKLLHYARCGLMKDRLSGGEFDPLKLSDDVIAQIDLTENLMKFSYGKRSE